MLEVGSDAFNKFLIMVCQKNNISHTEIKLIRNIVICYFSQNPDDIIRAMQALQLEKCSKFFLIGKGLLDLEYIPYNKFFVNKKNINQYQEMEPFKIKELEDFMQKRKSIKGEVQKEAWILEFLEWLTPLAFKKSMKNYKQDGEWSVKFKNRIYLSNKLLK